MKADRPKRTPEPAPTDLARLHQVLDEWYEATGAAGPDWDYIAGRLEKLALMTQSPQVREAHAPRPSRKSEAWLKRQLSTLDTNEEGD